jgi:hypothetical protein
MTIYYGWCPPAGMLHEQDSLSWLLRRAEDEIRWIADLEPEHVHAHPAGLRSQPQAHGSHRTRHRRIPACGGLPGLHGDHPGVVVCLEGSSTAGMPGPRTRKDSGMTLLPTTRP